MPKLNACKYALQVQDAPNTSGVLLGFNKLVEQVLEDYTARGASSFSRNEYIAQHPAIILYMDKMCDLINYDRDVAKYGKAYERATEYAKEADNAVPV